jgi:pyruvate,orthophosphate dikinase
VFRNQLGHSDDWGTGVIVQEMKFGNLDDGSGSGVTFTRNPRSSTTGIGLFGDFTLRSQGEDVVGGLVRPYPISESQRREYSPHLDMSLELAFPEIYRRLGELATLLIHEHGYEHQEIEFTFESDRPEDVHILQTRSLRLLRHEHTTVFADGDSLLQHLLGRGTGVAGGALSGRIVFGHDDLNRLRREAPDCHLILIRPDTVPEDLPLILEAEGLLTARGGATSHAAITARRLGKVCVVNCLDLEVNEGAGTAAIGGRRLKSGDDISIDGLLGNVYAGHHEVIQSSAGGLPLEGGLV